MSEETIDCEVDLYMPETVCDITEQPQQPSRERAGKVEHSCWYA